MYAELHPDADREFIEHALFYERREPGLGHRFIDEIERGIALLVSQPQIGPELDEELRYFVLDDFPFSLIYRIEPERIWIVAVAHQSRRPGYWRERIDR
ncbi:MAG: type II toxin-antitoxin system RelE/ParE family toxin [Gammaproteobacteria bacterium]|nr:type II toxin-antitoxin system RelE/ParE family toxin [Gammaproteobacteria bacterium]